ncbi:hypothetical protein WAI59_19750, partial [Acinetobacter baumannii]
MLDSPECALQRSPWRQQKWPAVEPAADQGKPNFRVAGVASLSRRRGIANDTGRRLSPENAR